MKKLTTIFAVIPVLLFVNSIPLPNEVTSIRWTSDQYKDMETGDLIQMSNEFECTPDGLSWSLFDGALPVSEVEWSLDASNHGFIQYQVASADLNGTVMFYLGSSSRAETNLKSDVGLMHFKFQFTEEQKAFVKSEIAPLLIGSN